VLALAAVAIWPRSHSAGATGQSLLDTVSSSGTWGPLVVFGLLLVAVLMVPRLLGPLVLVAGIPFRAFRNAERLARSSLSRDRSRTTLAAGAMVVGVAMVVALMTSAQGLRSISASWLAETVPGSELLTSIRPVAPTDPVLKALAATPGVTSVSPIAIFGTPFVTTSVVDGKPVSAAVLREGAAIVGRDYLASGRLNFVSGDPATALNALDSGGAVIVPSSFAGSAGIRLGDTVSFATGISPVKLRVVGIVAHSIPAGAQEAILVGWSDATSEFGVTGADFLAVRYLDGQEATARPVLDAAAISYALQPTGLDRISSAVGDALDRVFRLLDALALIAILVAGLGVVNTLSMSVFERVREIGVLRATGMTSRQVSGMVVVEAGVLGIVGSLVGAAVGLLVGSLMVVWSSGSFGLVFDPPWLGIAALAGLGVLVSVAAAIYPASVASRVSIIDAVQHE
jgi:putative ABC transport system permease protein